MMHHGDPVEYSASYDRLSPSPPGVVVPFFDEDVSSPKSPPGVVVVPPFFDEDVLSPTPSPQKYTAKKKKNKGIRHQEIAIHQVLAGFPPKWRLTKASQLKVERLRKDRNWHRRVNMIHFLYGMTSYRPPGSRYNAPTAESLERRSGDERTKKAQRLKHRVFGDSYLTTYIVKYL